MTGPALLEAHALVRRYAARGLTHRHSGGVTAVAGVTLSVERGEAFGLVGESGAGKSTLVRLLLALERPDSGAVHFDGAEISALPRSRLRPLRRRFQAVFQDPFASLNPYLSVSTIVAEPLVAHGLGDAGARRRRVAELLDMVRLPADAAGRRPDAFSGGERQRIAIARALAPEPELLILDEPVSSLDVTVQAQVLALLGELRRTLGLTLVLVSHDLAVVRRVCDRVAVMRSGEIVEEGSTDRVLRHPAHPYTRSLVSAELTLPG